MITTNQCVDERTCDTQKPSSENASPRYKRFVVQLFCDWPNSDAGDCLPAGLGVIELERNQLEQLCLNGLPYKLYLFYFFVLQTLLALQDGHRTITLVHTLDLSATELGEECSVRNCFE